MAGPASSAFRVEDVVLRLRAEDDALGAVARACLVDLGFEPEHRPTRDQVDLHISLVRDLAPPDPHRRVCGLERIAGGFSVGANGFRLTFGPEKGSASISVSTDKSQAEVGDVVTRAALALLRYARRYVLHAACAARTDGEGCLLVAPSGCGKSTLALGLAVAGWHHVADDLVLLGRPDKPLRVRRISQTLAVDPATAALFLPFLPALCVSAAPGHDKARVDAGVLFPERLRISCSPILICFPEIADAQASTLQRLEAAEVVVRLARQVNVIPGMEPAIAADQLETCRRLAEQCAGYRLLAGRDLGTSPWLLSDLIYPLLRCTP
jgi:hypothetical protein